MHSFKHHLIHALLQHVPVPLDSPHLPPAPHISIVMTWECHKRENVRRESCGTKIWNFVIWRKMWLAEEVGFAIASSGGKLCPNTYLPQHHHIHHIAITTAHHLNFKTYLFPQQTLDFWRPSWIFLDPYIAIFISNLSIHLAFSWNPYVSDNLS